MSNADYSENKSAPKAARIPAAVKSAPAPPFREKPAFPSAGLPGKAQSKDRSGGVRKAKIHPQSFGL